jgi:hypothetical protein
MKGVPKGNLQPPPNFLSSMEKLQSFFAMTKQEQWEEKRKFKNRSTAEKDSLTRAIPGVACACCRPRKARADKGKQRGPKKRRSKRNNGGATSGVEEAEYVSLAHTPSRSKAMVAKNKNKGKYKQQKAMEYARRVGEQGGKITTESLMHKHMASMKNDLIHAAETRENQLISKLLKALTSDDSPYATHTQLQTVMASMEAIVQKVKPTPSLPPSPVRKRNKQGYSGDMETEIPSGDEKPPDDQKCFPTDNKVVTVPIQHHHTTPTTTQTASNHPQPPPYSLFTDVAIKQVIQAPTHATMKPSIVDGRQVTNQNSTSPRNRFFWLL